VAFHCVFSLSISFGTFEDFLFALAIEKLAFGKHVSHVPILARYAPKIKRWKKA
jgi:hypothetical protein